MAETKPKAAPQRKPAARNTPPHTPKDESAVEPEPTEDERQALLSSYAALKGAGLPVPEEISRPVEGWIKQEEGRLAQVAEQEAALQQEIEKENAEGPWYVRNGYAMAPFSLRLESQTEKRRIELRPRGVPGDMYPLKEEDLNDPMLKRNCAIGVCEVIPFGQAKRIMEGQTTNMSQRSVHVPTALLRNEQGKEYPEGAVKAEVSWDQQGVRVATLDPEQMQGNVDDKRVTVQRSTTEQFIPTGGNPHIIESGPVQTVQGDVPQLDAAKAKIADDLARRKGGQGPASALSGMRVTVNPPQRS